MITVAMRMHWPPDGSSADLELTGAGPHHLPYDQLWAVDDQGTRYSVRFEGGRGETVTWFGVARLSPVPPRPRPAARPDRRRDPSHPAPPRTTGTARRPGRAQRPNGWRSRPRNACLCWRPSASWPAGTPGGQREGPGPGEIITVLTETGAIAAGSPLPGQLAALCQRLGAAGHGITVPAGRGDPGAVGQRDRAPGRACRPTPPSCSRRWPRSFRMWTGRGSPWPG